MRGGAADIDADRLQLDGFLLPDVTGDFLALELADIADIQIVVHAHPNSLSRGVWAAGATHIDPFKGNNVRPRVAAPGRTSLR